MNPEKRLEALEAYDIMDSLGEQEFNELVELASAICRTPISLISLLDDQRQWFKAKVGLGPQETPLNQAFCIHAIEKPNEVMVIENTLEDERFVNNPLVTGDPNIRFYAGAPLITEDNIAIGTLCVIDRVPREFSETETRALKILADKTIQLLDSRIKAIKLKNELIKKNVELDIILRRLEHAQEIAEIGSWEWKLRDNELYWSPQMFKIFGIAPDSDVKLTFETWQKTVHIEDLEAVKDSLRIAIKTGASSKVEYRVLHPNGKTLWISGIGRVENDEDGIPVTLSGTASNITENKISLGRKLIYLESLEETLFDVSHKIRKPVATCSGLVQAIIKDPNIVNPENVREIAKYFVDSVDEMEGFVKQMSDTLHHKKDILDKM
jgi:PAS domain-containing protein